jgi:hypothetical protein
MAIMDPLLNTGFLWRCLAAYAGIKADDEPPHDELESAAVTDQNDSSPGKRSKLDNIISSSDQVRPELDKQLSPKHSEYIRGDTYYTQLGIFKKTNKID